MMTDAEFLWKLIAVLTAVSGLVIAWLKIKGGQAIRIADQPIQTQKATHYVTEDELIQVINRIDRLERGQCDCQKQTEANFQEIFRELRGISRTLGRLEGSQHSQKNHE